MGWMALRVRSVSASKNDKMELSQNLSGFELAKQRHFIWLTGPPDIQLINKLVDGDTPHVVFYCQDDLGDWDGTHIDLMAMCREQSLLVLAYARGAFSSGFSWDRVFVSQISRDSAMRRSSLAAFAGTITRDSWNTSGMVISGKPAFSKRTTFSFSLRHGMPRSPAARSNLTEICDLPDVPPMSLFADICDMYNARGSLSSELSRMRMMIALFGLGTLNK